MQEVIETYRRTGKNSGESDLLPIGAIQHGPHRLISLVSLCLITQMRGSIHSAIRQLRRVTLEESPSVITGIRR